MAQSELCRRGGAFFFTHFITRREIRFFLTAAVERALSEVGARPEQASTRGSVPLFLPTKAPAAFIP